MLARWVRTWDSKVLRPLLLLLVHLGITPDALTLSSLLLVAAAGLLLSQGRLTLGGVVLLAGGFLDGLDGELARLRGCETRRGAFLDSSVDHIGDLGVHLGLVWLYLQSNARLEIILVFMALFGSMLGSQVRSRAGMLGVDTRATGLFTRFERIAILVAGLLSGQVTLALWVLALLNNVSALQRFFRALRSLPS